MAGILVARLDSMGDVLLTGPAVRAIAAQTGPVTFLAGPTGAAAATLLPGVGEVMVFDSPWTGFTPPAVSPEHTAAFVDEVRRRDFDKALIFTSFHQSPLPLALLLRLAGVEWIGAISPDYPGSLLDLRHQVEPGIHETRRALSLAVAAGFEPPPEDLGEPAVCESISRSMRFAGHGPYIVVHPGASVPARRMSASRSRGMVSALHEHGYRVLVTGAPSERALTADAAGNCGIDLGGRTNLPELAAVLRDAKVVVAPNTGPAHLAAAVGTPVVSLFAPVVPASQWAPAGVPLRILGRQDAPCRKTRARECPDPLHHCLDAITDDEVIAAVEELTHVSAPAGGNYDDPAL